MLNVNTNEENYLLKDSRNGRDKYNLVYLIVFFTGIGVMLPWNFFITIKPYFLYKLSDNTTNNSTKNTDLQGKFINYLALASMAPIFLVNILNLFIRRYITPMRRFTVGILTMFLMFLVTIILTKVQTENHTFFIITMISVVILNVCSGIIQASSLGIVSIMPGQYIKGFMEGQAISGMIASVANIITIAVVSRLDGSAFIYFFIALVILLITAVGFSLLGKIKFSRNFVKLSSQLDKYSEDIDSVTFSSDNQTISTTRSDSSLITKYRPIVRTIFWYGLSAAMTFVVTLSLFPATQSQIETTSDNPLWKKYFSPVTCFLLYNLGDYLGRFLCGFIKFPSERYPKLLFGATMIRWIFVPLFFMCNIPIRKHFPKILIHDAYPIILTLIFGLTNGYFITLALIYAPNQVDEREKEIVGTLMNFFLCIGLTLGVGLSFTYLYII